jgi:hypothetical protein
MVTTFFSSSSRRCAMARRRHDDRVDHGRAGDGGECLASSLCEALGHGLDLDEPEDLHLVGGSAPSFSDDRGGD